MYLKGEVIMPLAVFTNMLKLPFGWLQMWHLAYCSPKNLHKRKAW